ncbi:aminotransferase class V-fold PLP-dependent enzyme [Anaeromyxobacter sp. Fw109-5]|uniref:aminotransferase class V-fold PLP-dependent enzyme n=1 Tax=Anaeromyxobacter sp. (strain Fw109-5) TaxID=404589 RepID=UPI0000ED71EE|nr:aminotransferase class V-fold PLP-dependent enzyme [Anaeromyxobacter sp. Fw109-5]ABS27603.1 aminotransferase class V [Anaeromyxobacter sp. Fw109-5]
MTFAEATALLRASEIGRRTFVQSPLGPRLVTYADLTASGRALSFVEARVASARPLYANTHTALSTTGRAMTRLREDARAAIARCVHASEEDVVLFVGSGATAAVNKLVGLLGLRISEPLERRYRLSGAIPDGERPVVLVSPYEHHSNELPWLESVADVVEVELDAAGRLDLDDLARKARAHAGRPLRIGAFSAASNVSGALSDVRGIARVLHAHAFLACADYAAAGPYVPIDMHPPDPAERLDAIFVSTHKFLGGPEGSGILVAHRALFRSRAPERPGGGTVDYVGPGEAPGPAAPARLSVDYTGRLAEREEGGTPDILGDVRAGLAFLVKELVGPERILAHDVALAEAAVARLRRQPRVRLYGPSTGPRLPILSFNVEGLHHALVATLLDDLFGIQSRAGCSCAGPYGHRLLGIGPERSAEFRRAIAAGVQALKPGWVRISLPYHATPAEVDFLLSAIELLAEEGEAFVPLYRLGWMDGTWRRAAGAPPEPCPVDLRVGSLADLAAPGAAPEPPLSDEEADALRTGYLAEARRLAGELRARWAAAPPRWNAPTGEPLADRLTWFRYVHAS